MRTIARQFVTDRVLPALLWVLFAVGTGLFVVLRPDAALAIGISASLLAVALAAGWLRSLWSTSLWIALFGLAVWSYGFNNIPLIRPLPLVDALVAIAVVGGFQKWWRLRKDPIVRRLLFFLCALLVVVILRLVIDIPKYGLLALRDALFAFELWVIFPAIALGYALGEQHLNTRVQCLFKIAILWFLLYPWRNALISVSPIFGIQKPVPLFTFHTAGLLSVTAFFWFIARRGNFSGVIWMAFTLLVLLMVQGRTGYLAWFMSMFLVLFLHVNKSRLWAKVIVVILLGVFVLLVVGGKFTGRLGAPVAFHTVVAQLQTLVGKEEPGAGSFRHRMIVWPIVVNEVLTQPLGPLFGIGLGPDLFQGFRSGPVLVRKPHNDFLEIWARLGIIGLLPWISFLVVLGWTAFKAARRDLKHTWVLALQITLWITSMGEPAMGSSYITIPWAILSGLWIGAQLRQSYWASSYAYPSSPQPLPTSRR